MTLIMGSPDTLPNNPPAYALGDGHFCERAASRRAAQAVASLVALQSYTYALPPLLIHNLSPPGHPRHPSARCRHLTHTSALIGSQISPRAALGREAARGRLTVRQTNDARAAGCTHT